MELTSNAPWPLVEVLLSAPIFVSVDDFGVVFQVAVVPISVIQKVSLVPTVPIVPVEWSVFKDSVLLSRLLPNLLMGTGVLGQHMDPALAHAMVGFRCLVVFVTIQNQQMEETSVSGQDTSSEAATPPAALWSVGKASQIFELSSAVSTTDSSSLV